MGRHRKTAAQDRLIWALVRSGWPRAEARMMVREIIGRKAANFANSQLKPVFPVPLKIIRCNNAKN